MGRKVTIEQVVDYTFKELLSAINNLLVKNKNFVGADPMRDQGYYFKMYPQTHQYVSGPLKDQAAHLTEKVESVRDFIIEIVQEYEAELAERNKQDEAGQKPL